MKYYLSLALFLIGCATASAEEARFRKDINPALRYYQAFMLAPQLPSPDRDFLLTNEWRGVKLESRFSELLQGYDPEFYLLRHAAAAETRCDWGIDLTEGPNARLPGYAPAKTTAQIARLRTLWNLQHSRQTEARDDLIAVMALARNVSSDGILLATLIQFAMENITASVIAENYSRWEPEMLNELANPKHLPARGLVADCVPVEKRAFHGWLLMKTREIQSASIDESEKLARIRDLFNGIVGENDNDAKAFGERVVTVAGGKVEGVIKLVEELNPLYDEAAVILALPYREFGPRMKQWMERIEAGSNPLAANFLKVFEKCRAREFAMLAKSAMLRAAAEYKLHGPAGLASVPDPFGDGPFQMQRVVVENIDRGFELRSRLRNQDYNEVLVLVEKEGPALFVDGAKAGTLVSKGDRAK
jgi:hypothetical protein